MRRRTLILVLFPSILFLCMIGWSLYWIGNNQTTNNRPNKNKPQVIHYTTNVGH